jgi:hypothetical protein
MSGAFGRIGQHADFVSVEDIKYSYLGERDMESSGGVGLQVKGIAQQSSPSRHWARKTKQI